MPSAHSRSSSSAADQQRQLAYDRVKTERDKLAAELADKKLAELLPRIIANDREVESINAQALPSVPSPCLPRS